MSPDFRATLYTREACRETGVGCAVGCTRWGACSFLLVVVQVQVRSSQARKDVSVFLMVWKQNEGNVLFNGTHNTFYLQLYGVGQLVKDD